MSKKNNIFEVDIKGLRELQQGKPKWFIPRELLQNALDENVKKVIINLIYKQGKAHITVTDDSPIGFRDLADAYTLFKDTYKRTNVNKRGRFNFGEKQVLCLSDYALIITTTGGLEFDVMAGTRKTLRRKRDVGSEVYVVVKMSPQEFEQCCTYCNDILVPEGIQITVTHASNSKFDSESNLLYKEPHKIFRAKLQTEKKEDDRMRTVSLETDVHIHKPEDGKASYIYEMGIPVCEIDCEYSIDVQQKVPLSNDRDNVDAKYLKTIYGEVLNQVYEEIKEEQSSALWVRTGFVSDRATTDARTAVIKERFGDKALIANPKDRRSMDEAISNNFKVIYGGEMNGDEWNVVKQDSLLISTSSMFKTGVADGRMVSNDELTDNQLRVAMFTRLVAKQMLGLTIKVSFYDSPDATVKADFNRESMHLRFNAAHFTSSEWELVAYDINVTRTLYRVKQELLDLIIHELGHSAGMHYEHSYHDCITLLGSKLACEALSNPNFFNANYTLHTAAATS